MTENKYKNWIFEFFAKNGEQSETFKCLQNKITVSLKYFFWNKNELLYMSLF